MPSEKKSPSSHVALVNSCIFTSLTLPLDANAALPAETTWPESSTDGNNTLVTIRLSATDGVADGSHASAGAPRYFCGRNVIGVGGCGYERACGACDGICGPRDGCQCRTCARAQQGLVSDVL